MKCQVEVPSSTAWLKAHPTARPSLSFVNCTASSERRSPSRFMTPVYGTRCCMILSASSPQSPPARSSTETPLASASKTSAPSSPSTKSAPSASWRMRPASG
uniref:Uncharacterized protein n=1 Tax=Arundo donax TaxID=35708 RepID=A0A0A9DZB3_ARUDO